MLEENRDQRRQRYEWYAANLEAHDAYEGPQVAHLTRVEIHRNPSAGLPKETYAPMKFYLANYSGAWIIGTLYYLSEQQRFLFRWFWGTTMIQVEHLNQLYVIDLPFIPENLIAE